MSVNIWSTFIVNFVLKFLCYETFVLQYIRLCRVIVPSVFGDNPLTARFRIHFLSNPRTFQLISLFKLTIVNLVFYFDFSIRFPSP